MANRKNRIARELALLEKEQAIKTHFNKKKQTTKIGIRPLLDIVVNTRRIRDIDTKEIYNKVSKVYREKELLRRHYFERDAIFTKLLQHPKVLFSEMFIYERLCEMFFRLEICREFETWKIPKSKTDAVLFKSLVMHLFVKYRIPKSVEQDIYNYGFIHHGLSDFRLKLMLHVIKGKGIHKLEDLKFGLNSKMNFHFHNAPLQFDARKSVWWAKARGKGASYSMATKMVDNLCFYGELNWVAWYDDFIFFINRIPEVPQKELNLIFDFLINQKHSDKKIRIPNYEDEISIPALYPEFTFKGRTLASVMKFVDKWNTYVKMFKEAGILGVFKTSPVQPFKVKHHKNVIRFRQIKSLKELVLEGTLMNHCVGTYGEYCVRGESSIWSVREVFQHRKTKKLLTIEVEEKEKRISQINGKNNRFAKDHEMQWIKTWAEREGLTIADDTGE